MWVNIDLNNIEAKEMVLINIIGEIVWQDKSVSNQTIVDTQLFPSGIYYLSIITSDDKIVTK